MAGIYGNMVLNEAVLKLSTEGKNIKAKIKTELQEVNNNIKQEREKNGIKTSMFNNFKFDRNEINFILNKIKSNFKNIFIGKTIIVTGDYNYGYNNVLALTNKYLYKFEIRHYRDGGHLAFLQFREYDLSKIIIPKDIIILALYIANSLNLEAIHISKNKIDFGRSSVLMANNFRIDINTINLIKKSMESQINSKYSDKFSIEWKNEKMILNPIG